MGTLCALSKVWEPLCALSYSPALSPGQAAAWGVPSDVTTYPSALIGLVVFRSGPHDGVDADLKHSAVVMVTTRHKAVLICLL